MKIIEYMPERIMISAENLKTAIENDRELAELEKDNRNSRDLLLALGGGWVSCLVAIIPSWGSWGVPLRTIMGVIFAIFTLSTLWFLIKYVQSRGKLKNKRRDDLSKTVIGEAKKKIRYTALLIICCQESENGEVKFMTEKDGNYLVHCDMESDKEVIEQRECVTNFLATSYNIQRNHILHILPLSDVPFFSIKPVHGVETQNGFIFFQILLKRSAKESLLSHRNTEWKSIQEMEEMPELMGRNQDIIMALIENSAKIKDSFEQSHGPLHIIWNITKECPYNCEICATRDDTRKELDTDGKLKVLEHIYSVKEQISNLDFAGGDPVYHIGTRRVIIQAINSIGEEKVSVTTTGKGIQAIDNAEDELSLLLKRCEITIDASHENLAIKDRQSLFPRRSPEYCTYNYTQIQNMSDSIQYLMINIPLLDSDLDNNEIENLVQKLLILKQNYSDIQLETQIIRLMPVGAFSKNEDYNKKYAEYQPVEVAKKLKRRIEEIGIPCKYHCSLRVLPSLGAYEDRCGRCSMLEKKIGIDCSGNVFACTWGAYLQISGEDITQNPFYLGSLLSMSLKEILEGQRNRTLAYRRISRYIQNQTKMPYCEMVSCYFDESLKRNKDPLST